GARVLVNYLSNRADADNVVAKVEHAGGQAVAYQADVRDFRQVTAMAEFALSQWGAIDVHVNSAGGAAHNLGGRDETILEQDIEMWDKVVTLNLKGTFLCIKAVAPHMIRQRSGHIINVSSGSGLRGNPAHSPYNAAKAAIFGL